MDFPTRSEFLGYLKNNPNSLANLQGIDLEAGIAFFYQVIKVLSTYSYISQEKMASYGFEYLRRLPPGSSLDHPKILASKIAVFAQWQIFAQPNSMTENDLNSKKSTSQSQLMDTGPFVNGRSFDRFHKSLKEDKVEYRHKKAFKKDEEGKVEVTRLPVQVLLPPTEYVLVESNEDPSSNSEEFLPCRSKTKVNQTIQPEDIFEQSNGASSPNSERRLPRQSKTKANQVIHKVVDGAFKDSW